MFEKLKTFLACNLAAVALLAVAYWLIAPEAAADLGLARNGVTTSATLVDKNVATKRTGGGSSSSTTTKIYTFFYNLAAGKKPLQSKSEVSRSTYEMYEIGARLPVTYLPENPSVSRFGSRAYVLSLLALWGGGVAVLVILAAGLFWLGLPWTGKRPGPS